MNRLAVAVQIDGETVANLVDTGDDLRLVAWQPGPWVEELIAAAQHNAGSGAGSDVKH